MANLRFFFFSVYGSRAECGNFPLECACFSARPFFRLAQNYKSRSHYPRADQGSRGSFWRPPTPTPTYPPTRRNDRHNLPRHQAAFVTVRRHPTPWIFYCHGYFRITYPSPCAKLFFAPLPLHPLPPKGNGLRRKVGGRIFSGVHIALNPEAQEMHFWWRPQILRRKMPATSRKETPQCNGSMTSNAMNRRFQKKIRNCIFEQWKTAIGKRKVRSCVQKFGVPEFAVCQTELLVRVTKLVRYSELMN